MQAGGMIIDYAMKNQQCQKPHLLLENTPWGNSNLVNMSKALKFYDIQSPQVTRFNLSVKAKDAQVLIDSIINQGSDCIILVSNAVEGAVLANVMLEVPRSKRLPIISHWGITSGDLHEKIDAKAREGLALHFIQSCFAFTNETQTPLANQVFSQLIEHTKGTIKNPADLQSAVGFIHAYDLTKLLIQAIKQSKLTGNTLKDRNTIRLALENLSNPVQGLIKTYDKPFSVFDFEFNNKAHEALNDNDYCMGHYGAMDEIIIINE
jgi:branched-chain amino acid transport system substrate-binding protein